MRAYERTGAGRESSLFAAVRRLGVASTALFWLSACSDQATAPQRDAANAGTSAAPSSSAGSLAPAPLASAAVEATEPAAKPLLLAPTPILEQELPSVSGVYELNGELLVTAGLRVGRIRDSSVEWIANASARDSERGVLNWIGGRYPDAFFATLGLFTEGRGLPAEVFLQLGDDRKWMDRPQQFVPHGLAIIGGSTLVLRTDLGLGPALVSVAGPELRRQFTTAREQGCEVSLGEEAAVRPLVITATPDGTLVAAGRHCLGKPALELWKPNQEKGTTVMLDSLWPGAPVEFLHAHAAGDSGLWIVSSAGAIEVKGGAASKLGGLSNITESLVSDGALYATDGFAIHRWDKSDWTKVASFNWRTDFGGHLVRHRGKFYRGSGKLEELQPTASIEFAAACQVPMVLLEESGPSVAEGFAYPQVRKVLQTFADVKSIELVAFEVGSTRQLGVKVPNARVGEALVKHLTSSKTARLICYAPTSARTIGLSN